MKLIIGNGKNSISIYKIFSDVDFEKEYIS